MPVKRKHLSAAEKKELCLKKQKYPTILNSELAKDFGVGESCVSQILRTSTKWLSINATNKLEASRKCERKPRWPQLEEAMCLWAESALAANMDLTQAALIAKAKTFVNA